MPTGCFSQYKFQTSFENWIHRDFTDPPEEADLWKRFKPLSRIGFIATRVLRLVEGFSAKFQTSFENWIHRDPVAPAVQTQGDGFQTSFENWIHRDWYYRPDVGVGD